MESEMIKVSQKSGVNAVAGAIAGIVRQNKAVEIQVIGAGALNQAVKAVIVARGFVAPEGLDLTMTPSFSDIEINGTERTAIRLVVESK